MLKGIKLPQGQTKYPKASRLGYLGYLTLYVCQVLQSADPMVSKTSIQLLALVTKEWTLFQLDTYLS